MSSSTPDSPFAYARPIGQSSDRPAPTRAFSSSAAGPFNSSALRRGASQPPGPGPGAHGVAGAGASPRYGPTHFEEADELSGLHAFDGAGQGGGGGRTWSASAAGVIGARYAGEGSAAVRNRWSGVLGLHQQGQGGGDGNGMQTRSSSFSAGETRRLQHEHSSPSYTRETTYGSHPSSSPFPTFSETSSPSSSPRMPSYMPGNAHSPPRVPAAVSRSRSQSLAVGARPHLGGGLVPMPPVNPGVAGPSPLHKNTSPWGGDGGAAAAQDALMMNALPPDVSNMSPFARDLQSILADEVQRGPQRQTMRGFQPEGEHLTGRDLSGGRWLGADAGAGAGAGHSKLSSSVTTRHGEYYEHGNGHASHAPQGGLYGDAYGVHDGVLSGTSSRRHSVSVVGGPTTRRGFDIPGGFGFSDSLRSPPERESVFGFAGKQSYGTGGLTGSSLGRKTGFSDDDLLADGLDSALKISGSGSKPGQADRPERTDPWGTSPSHASRPTAIRQPSSYQRTTSTDRAGGSSAPRDQSVERMRAGADGGKREGSRFEFGRSSSWKNEDNVLNAGTPPGASGLGPTSSRPTGFAGAETSDNRSFGHNRGADASTMRQNTFQGSQAQLDQGRERQPFASPGIGGARGFPEFVPQQGPPDMRGYASGYQGYPAPGPGFNPTYGQQSMGQPPPRGAGGPYGGGPMQQPSFVGSIGQGMGMSSGPHDQGFSDLGKGIPLSLISPQTPLYIVEFKAGRTDLFYCDRPDLRIARGDLVVVEADRGQDLGKVTNDVITLDEVKAFQAQRQQELAQLTNGPQGSKFIKASGPLAGLEVGMGLMSGDGGMDGPNPAVVRGLAKEIMPKRIFGKAGPADQQLLVTKLQDEAQALSLCQSKVKQKRLPMEVIDAEYQWDRRKLTFYFVAEKRIDFRELVRELFRLHKTRIWMASL